MALVGGVALTGFDTRTWLVVAATILGPQLAGHTVLNGLLKELGSVTVSLALLLEPFGASVLVWVLFDELPPPAVAVGAPLVVAGLALQLTYGRSGHGS
jgi:drug/metabolite transporter (DMT)-like permease